MLKIKAKKTTPKKKKKMDNCPTNFSHHATKGWPLPFSLPGECHPHANPMPPPCHPMQTQDVRKAAAACPLLFVPSLCLPMERDASPHNKCSGFFIQDGIQKSTKNKQKHQLTRNNQKLPTVECKLRRFPLSGFYYFVRWLPMQTAVFYYCFLQQFFRQICLFMVIFFLPWKRDSPWTARG